jgi:hypothetical protein
MVVKSSVINTINDQMIFPIVNYSATEQYVVIDTRNRQQRAGNPSCEQRYPVLLLQEMEDAVMGSTLGLGHQELKVARPYIVRD